MWCVCAVCVCACCYVMQCVVIIVVNVLLFVSVSVSMCWLLCGEKMTVQKKNDICKRTYITPQGFFSMRH